MKKFAIIIAGLLLMLSFGCSTEEKKETTEKTGNTATVTPEKSSDLKDRAAALTREAASVAREAAGEAKKKAEEIAGDAAPATREAIGGIRKSRRSDERRGHRDGKSCRQGQGKGGEDRRQGEAATRQSTGEARIRKVKRPDKPGPHAPVTWVDSTHCIVPTSRVKVSPLPFARIESTADFSSPLENSAIIAPHQFCPALDPPLCRPL